MAKYLEHPNGKRFICIYAYMLVCMYEYWPIKKILLLIFIVIEVQLYYDTYMSIPAFVWRSTRSYKYVHHIYAAKLLCYTYINLELVWSEKLTS